MRHKHSATEDPKTLIGVAALAAGVGAAVATLLNSRSGNQAKENIKSRAKHVKDVAQDKLKQNHDTVVDEIADNASDKLHDAANSMKAESKTEKKAQDKAHTLIDKAKITAKKVTKELE